MTDPVDAIDDVIHSSTSNSRDDETEIESQISDPTQNPFFPDDDQPLTSLPVSEPRYIPEEITLKNQNVVIFGAGFVGTPTAAFFASQWKQTTFHVIDVDKTRIDAWNDDNPTKYPFFEPELSLLVDKGKKRGNLRFRIGNPAVYAELLPLATLFFICVPTNPKQHGFGKNEQTNLQFVEQVVRTIAIHCGPFAIVVEKSTVPAETSKIIYKVLTAVSPTKRFDVLSNPEFLSEGTAIRDIRIPSRILIGSQKNTTTKITTQCFPTLMAMENPPPPFKALQLAEKYPDYPALLLHRIYSKWVDPRFIIDLTATSSEIGKLVSNTMLAQRISTMNAISAICEAVNADILEVKRAISLDARIGPRYLMPSVGFGGSCLRKDVLMLAYIAKIHHLDVVAQYLKSIVDINQWQTERFGKKIVSEFAYNLHDKIITIFGFAYKKHTSDCRDSPAIPICKMLLEEGAILHIVDFKVPQAKVFREFQDIQSKWNSSGGPRLQDRLFIHEPLYELSELNLYPRTDSPSPHYSGRGYVSSSTNLNSGTNNEYQFPNNPSIEDHFETINSSVSIETPTPQSFETSLLQSKLNSSSNHNHKLVSKFPSRRTKSTDGTEMRKQVGIYSTSRRNSSSNNTKRSKITSIDDPAEQVRRSKSKTMGDFNKNFMASTRKDLFEQIAISPRVRQEYLDACTNSHALIFLTEWEIFEELDFKQISKVMKRPKYIFDGRLILSNRIEELRLLEYNIFSIGS